MKGLVAYADDSEDEQMKEPMSNDVPLKTTANNSEPRKKPQVIIKRGPRKSRTTRAHVSEDIVEPLIREPPVASTSSEPMTGSATPPQEDELFHIRKLLRPPPLPGVDDWGIPPAPTTPCDPALQAKLAQFQALKSDPDNPRHFNDSLMSNRSFRNPHLYAKLVEFVDVDERATNFPKGLWNPDDLNPEWYADKIAEVQKTRYEQQSSGKGNGKRTIDFTSSKAKAKEPQKDGTRYNPYGSHHYPQGSQKKGRW